MKQFRSPDLSLWQSAVDQVVSTSNAGNVARSANSPLAVTRPNPTQSLVTAADEVAIAAVEGQEIPEVTAGQVARGFTDTAKFCASMAFKLAKAEISGDSAEADRLRKELTTPMGPCDPRWAEVVAIYLHNRVKGGIPYRRHQALSDFVTDGRLPAKCRVALIADWGTGD